MGIDPEDAEDHVCEPGAPAWLATMGDLMSLLLVFFVLMLSFANMDRQLFLEAMGSIQHALGLVEKDPGQFRTKSESLVSLSREKSTPFMDVMKMPTTHKQAPAQKKMLAKINQSITENNLSRIIQAETAERGVIVRVKGQALFAAGTDNLLPESFQFLDEIVRLIQEFPYEVSIEGHTDDTPINSPRFPSNWHLSAARAISVVHYVADAGDIPYQRLAAVGMANTRPLVENDSLENRTINRRVEFVFLRDPTHIRESRSERNAREREAAEEPRAD